MSAMIVLRISTENMIWIGSGLAILFTAAVAGLVLARRFFHPGSQSSGEPAGFTLKGLQNMHQKGLISDEEYQQMKAKIAAEVKGDMPDETVDE